MHSRKSKLHRYQDRPATTVGACPFSSSGFTLVEMMVALSLLVFMITIAVPAFQQFIRKSQMVSSVNRFVSALQLSRSEAIKRARDTVLCPTKDGLYCHESPDWSPGWLLLTRQPAMDEDPVIRSITESDNGIIMQSSNRRRRIIFQPDGSAGGSNSSFTFCDREGLAPARVICLSGTGRPRLTRTRCDGRPIHCPD